MSRKCSHCGLNGHNSRTCLLGTAMASRTFDGGGTIVTTNTTNTTDIHTCRRAGIRLFGVDMVAADAEVAAPEPFDCMRKSWSMGNLAHYGNQEETPPPSMVHSLLADPVDGYTSDDLVHATSNSRERRKGVPWSEEEHRLFLVGLERLGKGDWRGISRNFVKTRTPTQVASHAQKYFLRRGNIHKRRRRSSLFDITPDTAASTSLQAQESSHKGVGRIEALPSIDEMSTSNFVDSDKMETEEVPGGEAFNMGEGRENVFPIYCDEGGGDGPLAERSSVEYRPAGLDLPSQVGGGGNRYDTVALLVPMWPPLQPLDPVPVPVSMPVVSNSKVVKPIPLIRIGGVPLPPLSPSPPPKVMDNEVVKLSVLSLNSTHPVMPPSALSRKLHEEEELGKRHSAFQAITSAVPDANSDLDTTGNTCNAAISVS